ILPTPIHKLTLTGVSVGERTGSRVFQWVWSWVSFRKRSVPYECPSCLLSL
ncbi:hypothetical protein B0T09DRAFT_235927, partial [Sordaria sp. MPI-SDFR-AT-0083]